MRKKYVARLSDKSGVVYQSVMTVQPKVLEDPTAYEPDELCQLGRFLAYVVRAEVL